MINIPYKDKEERRKAQRRYYQKHKKEIFARVKRNKCSRLTSLGTTNGRFCGLHKRIYPKNNICELCKTYKKYLAYHHWDDDLNKGMWICNGCHFFVERIEKKVEKEFEERYIKLKKKVESEMPLHMKKQHKTYKKDAIKNLLEKGYKSIDISKILSVNKDYVNQIKTDFNIPTIMKWTSEKKEYLINNYGKIKPSKIAKKLGFTIGAVYSQKFILKKDGLIT